MIKECTKRFLPFCNIEKKMYDIYQKSRKWYIRNNKFIEGYYEYKMYKKYNCAISGGATIDSTVKFPHPIGVVIGENVSIGKDVTIYQNVTIGENHEKYPTIGNNVTIYAGAKLIGDIKIGNNVIIGANSVVTHDIPDNCVIAGVPAKIIKKKE